MAEAFTTMNLRHLLAALAGGTSKAAGIVVDRRAPAMVELPTMKRVVSVDARLWRGPAPTMLQYGELADAGVGLVVDLRGESDLEETARVVESFEMHLMALPTNPARSPQPAHVEQFIRRHGEHQRITYVHADDSGRTSAIIGAYLVTTGTRPSDAVSAELAAGPLTTSQMAYIASGGRRPLVVGMLDRVIDRPTNKFRSLRK